MVAPFFINRETGENEMDAKLRKEAEDLGIAVDSRWSDTTLRQKVDEKKADNVAAGPGGFTHGLAEGPSKEALSGKPMADEGGALPQEATPKAMHSGAVKIEVAGQNADLIALVKKAIELNILVDEKWDVDRLRAEIQMAREGRADLQVKGAIPPAGYGAVDYDAATKADKTPVELVADYWNAEGNRVAAGNTIKVSRDEAQRLISGGAAKRADPLP